MELDQQVIEIFHSNIDSTMQAMDALAPQISDCSILLVQSLLSEKKVLCCGEGQSGALTQIFASNLLNRFDYERPSLPAIALNTDATVLTAVTGDNSFNEIFAGQIRALGLPGDLLLSISNGSNSRTTLPAIQAAHDREMVVIAISSKGNNDIPALLQPEDIELCIPDTNRARVAETQLLVINCLCNLIDQQLFGSH